MILQRAINNDIGRKEKTSFSVVTVFQCHTRVDNHLQKYIPEIIYTMPYKKPITTIYPNDMVELYAHSCDCGIESTTPYAQSSTNTQFTGFFMGLIVQIPSVLIILLFFTAGVIFREWLLIFQIWTYSENNKNNNSIEI